MSSPTGPWSITRSIQKVLVKLMYRRESLTSRNTIFALSSSSMTIFSGPPATPSEMIRLCQTGCALVAPTTVFLA